MPAAVELRVERRAAGGAATQSERLPGSPERLPAIVGRAAVYGVLSEDLGGFRERIEPGAFAASIAEDDIRALFNHRDDYVLGRNRADTLRLSDDGECLQARIEPPDTSFARDLLASVERGDISGMSIGFRAIDDEWNVLEGMPVRTLKAARLFDVSAVAFPAYAQTEVALRSLRAFRQTRGSGAWHRNIARRRLDLAAFESNANKTQR